MRSRGGAGRHGEGSSLWRWGMAGTVSSATYRVVVLAAVLLTGVLISGVLLTGVLCSAQGVGGGPGGRLVD